jgi:hypothetical protein
MTAPRILLPFLDDSTLFFARAMRDLMAPLGARTVLARLTGPDDLTDRQMREILPGGPDLVLSEEALAAGQGLAGFDAVVTCRVMRALKLLMAAGDFRARPGRPAIVAFTGGLDFFPARGFANRMDCDAVFVQSAAAMPAFRRMARDQGVAHWQHVDHGHPFLMQPEPGTAARVRAEARPEIWFFAQAISPRTRASRLHMLRVLAAIARAHPDRPVRLKLRHLPGENAGHLHREEHDYPALMADLPGGRPANLDLVAGPMAEALDRAGIGITCTSTAAADLLGAGIPTLVHLDYVENYLDPLVAPMRAMFAGSGLIAGLEDLLALRTAPPDPAWLEGFLCPRDLGARVLATIAAFRAARPA